MDDMPIERAAERLTLADALIMVQFPDGLYRYVYIPHEGSVYGVGQEVLKLTTVEQAHALVRGEFKEEFEEYGARYSNLATTVEFLRDHMIPTSGYDAIADKVRERTGMSCFYLYAWDNSRGIWEFKGQEPDTPGYVGPERNWWQGLSDFFVSEMSDAEVALQIYVNSQRPSTYIRQKENDNG